MSNQIAYEVAEVVQSYSTLDYLQKPEQTIFNLLKADLYRMKMLDIGVGGGRTTVHFAPLVKEYVGVDYSESMIKACERRFSKREEKISFDVADVRSMHAFEDGYFDFILFSYNGLDSISHEDRLKSLAEIKRVGAAGGIFVFSTHNLQNLKDIYKVRFFPNPIKLAYQIMSFCIMLFYNGLPGKYKNKPYAILRDRVHRFRFNHYFIRPAAQIDQLRSLGFKNIRLFSELSGEELDIYNKNGLDQNKDPWIYYMCEM